MAASTSPAKYRLALQKQDTGSRPTQAVAATKKLLDDTRMKFIIASTIGWL
jgi:hypothetical protein